MAAELAHWRWKFVVESDGLRDSQVVTEHTFFRARFTGLELDLTLPPWSVQRTTWRHPTDDAPCQEVASAARALDPPVQAIRYESARREGGACNAVFDLGTLRLPRQSLQQTWICKTTRQRVLWSHDTGSLQFEME